MAAQALGTGVYALSDTITKPGTAGATIAAGDAVCAYNGKYEKAAANVLGKNAVIGVALNAATIGQPVRVALEGRCEGASGLKAGAIYALSNTAGQVTLAPATDLTEDTSYVSVVCIGLSTTSFLLAVASSGVIMNLA